MSLFAPSGRIAIIGHSSIGPLGPGALSYATRIGEFEAVVPEYAVGMGLVVPDGDVFIPQQKVIAGRPQDLPADASPEPMSRAEVTRVFGDYIDHNIGLRIMRPEDSEWGKDPQRFIRKFPTQLMEDTKIAGQLFRKGETVYLPKEVQLPESHAGFLPSGWSMSRELGLMHKHPFNGFSELHWIMTHLLADSLLSTGLTWEELDQATEPEQRKVAASPGMGPGKLLVRGLGGYEFGDELETDLLARYLADNPSFWLMKWLNARHSSARVGACNTGICNLEDMVAAMRTGEVLFGAAATFESAITDSSIAGFNQQQALATDRNVAELNDHPSLVSRPGLADRSGFVMATAGGMFLLMDWQLAQALGAIIYGELLTARTAGGPPGSDNPAEPTEGVILAMQRGLNDIVKLDGSSPQQVINSLGLINGHGTSTPKGDINGMKCYSQFAVTNGRDPKRPVLVTYQKGGPRIEGKEGARQVGGVGEGHSLGGAATKSSDENVRIHERGIIPPAVAGIALVDPKIQELPAVLPTTAPLVQDVEVAMAEAEGFADTNGASWTRRFDEDRYVGAKAAAGYRAERIAKRDEDRRAVAQGTRKLGEFLPPKARS